MSGDWMEAIKRVKLILFITVILLPLLLNHRLWPTPYTVFRFDISNEMLDSKTKQKLSSQPIVTSL